MGLAADRNGAKRIDIPPAAATQEVRTDPAPHSTTSTVNLAAYSKAGDVYFFASDHEADYPDAAKKITVNGGTFVGIAGGMEHNFAYWVASQPDKIVLYDVNSWAIKLAKAKFELVLSCNTYKEFAQKFDRIFKGRETFSFVSITADDASELVLAGIKTSQTALFLSPRCDRDNGWNTPEQFETLKRIIGKNAIEFVQGDLLAEDFPNQSDVSIIFLSDIFGIGANQERKAQMIVSLRRHYSTGGIRGDAQVIDATHPENVAGIVDYIG